MYLALDFVRRRAGENFDIDLFTQRNIIEKALDGADAVKSILFQDASDHLAALLWAEDEKHLYRHGLKTAEFLYDELASLGFRDTAIGVGDTAASLDTLSASYQSACEVLASALLRGQSGVSAYREVAGKTGKLQTEEPQWGALIAAALKSGDTAGAEKRVAEMTTYFRKTAFKLEAYHIQLALTLASIIQSCKDMDIPLNEIFTPPGDPFEKIKESKNLDEVKNWFTALAGRIGAYIVARQDNFSQIKVREALDYLESHYADTSLSLSKLCKKIDISMSYLSACLKKYHDKTFVEELTAIRMKKAMELLKTTDMMTYEIAEKAGYRDAHYFSLSFRKYTGLTSTEFRSRNVHEQD
jgi:two-component system response regulator YesN